MSAQTQKYLANLLSQRDKLFNLIQIRKTLGGFDANAEAILINLEATLAIVNYQISLAEDTKGK